MTQPLLCTLKSNEKVFHLPYAEANSCCKGYPVDLKKYQNLNQVFEFWNQEQQLLQQGIQVKSCDSCWQNEKIGRTSYRISQGQNFVGNDIRLILSNACNQMCSYCLPKYSSTWHNEIKKNGPFEKISIHAKQRLQLVPVDRVAQDQWISQLNQYLHSQPNDSVTLTLYGGEPLMQLDSLQTLLDLCSTKIKKVSVISNLNPPDNKFLSWLLNNFSNQKLSFAISLDATPEFNHIPRAYFDQQKFSHNLKLLQQADIKFKFLAVCSVLNFFNLPEYTKWADQNQFEVMFNKLTHPDCLDFVYIPNIFADPIRNQLTQSKIPQFINETQLPSALVDLKLKEQYNYLSQYFERTGIQVNNTVFEPYWNWLKAKNENSISI